MIKAMINYDDFKKLDLRVAKIIEAEKISGSEKLLKLQIDLGGEKRQLVAGIAQFYEPSALVGRQIVVVANLEPRKMMGFESQGMLLAADENGRPVLLAPDSAVEPGTMIK